MKINKKTLITLGITIGSLLAIHYLKLDQYAWYGIWTSIGWFFNHFPSLQFSLTNDNQYIYYSGMQIVLSWIILGFILKLCKIERGFVFGMLTGAFAYLLAKIVSTLLHVSTRYDLMIMVLTATIAAAGALWLVRHIKKLLYIWLLIAGLIIFSTVGLPYITNAIAKPIAAAKRQDDLKAAVGTLQFTAYYPSYAPTGLTKEPATLVGYHGTLSSHKRIEYQVGKVEFFVSEKLKNQDQIFNKTTNCDVSSIWFEGKFRSEILQSTIDRSLDNLSICQILGKTDDGNDVYIEANKSQFEFYYMEIGNSIIVSEYDKVNGPKYADNFRGEILKIYNSMKQLDISQIKAGY